MRRRKPDPWRGSVRFALDVQLDAGTVSNNAHVTGIVIAALAIAALAAFAVWEEWLNLVVGLWALVSSWVLGFQGTTAMTVHVIIGAAAAILAAIELWMTSQIPPRLPPAAERSGH